jgi:hypothetical protein
MRGLYQMPRAYADVDPQSGGMGVSKLCGGGICHCLGHAWGILARHLYVPHPNEGLAHRFC